MAEIIAFPRATTPRRTTPPDYTFLQNIASTALRQGLPAAAQDPHALAQMLRSIADDLDRLPA